MEVKPDGYDVRFFGPGHHRYYNSDDVDTNGSDHNAVICKNVLQEHLQDL